MIVAETGGATPGRGGGQAGGRSQRYTVGMNRVRTAVTLEGDPADGQPVPAEAVGEVLRLTPPVLRGCVRMVAEGRSHGRGRRPEWLSAAATPTFAGAESISEFGLRLHFEVPRLGDAAPALFRQRAFFWEGRQPRPDATAFDLLGDVLADVRSREGDSVRFDRGLLRAIRRFRDGVGSSRRTVRQFSYQTAADARRVVVDAGIVSAADRLLEETPRPRRVRVVGTLDMVRASTRAFGLRLDSGEELPGVLLGNDEAKARERLIELLNARVVVHGRLIYRPSGRPLRLDAEILEPTAEEAAFFARLPPVPERPPADRPSPGGAIGSVFGRWPGDESEEQIAAALAELS